MSKRVIVTGVTGQDGSYMVDYLLANTDHLIWGMVRRTSKPDLGNLRAALSNPRFKTIVGDLADGASIDNVVKEVKPDYFINLAAQSFVGSSWTIPEQTFDIDAIGVIRCLEAIRKHVPHCRFYNAGSSEEHGDVVHTPQGIDHPPRARSPYGAAKIAARQITKVYRESYGLYAVQGLLSNHESERRGEEFVTRKITLGVARIARAIKDGKPFEPIELGNLDAKRDWSHAEDFVEGMWRMLNQEIYRTDEALYDGFIAEIHPYDLSKTELDQIRVTSKHIREYVLASGETHTVREFIEKAWKVAEQILFPTLGSNNGRWYNSTGKPEDEVFERGYIGGQLKDGQMVPVDEVPGLIRRDPTHVSGLGWNQTIVRINPAFYRPNDVELLLGDSAPARKDLGWQPKVSFDQLVTRMVKSDLAAVGIGS